jgi:hypothetical protein
MKRRIQLFASINAVEAVNRALSKHTFHLRKPRPQVLDHEDTDSEKLIDITAGAHDMLITATTVFPFVLFPDTINIDRQKLTIIHRSFFRVADVISVQIDDIQNVESSVGPFFGSIRLTSRYFINNFQSIKFLQRGDVVKIQRLLQGYMIAHHRKIDCSTIDKAQLIILLNDLGQGSSN